jgi:hypothetical protein
VLSDLSQPASFDPALFRLADQVTNRPGPH